MMEKGESSHGGIPRVPRPSADGDPRFLPPSRCGPSPSSPAGFNLPLDAITLPPLHPSSLDALTPLLSGFFASTTHLPGLHPLPPLLNLPTDHHIPTTSDQQPNGPSLQGLLHIPQHTGDAQPSLTGLEVDAAPTTPYNGLRSDMAISTSTGVAATSGLAATSSGKTAAPTTTNAQANSNVNAALVHQVFADLPHPNNPQSKVQTDQGRSSEHAQANQSSRMATPTPLITTNFLRPPRAMQVQHPSHDSPLMTVDLSQSTMNDSNTPNAHTPSPQMLCTPYLMLSQSNAVPCNATAPSQVYTARSATTMPTQATPLHTQTGHQSTPLRPLTYAASLNVPKQSGNIPPILPDVPLEYKTTGTHNGLPLVSFSEDEMSKVIPLFEHSLILKFAGRNPSLARIREEVAKWGIVQPYSVGIMDYRHTLVRMTSPDDLRRAQSVEAHKIDGCLFRSFKWSPDFSLKKESSLTPIWVQFPWLPFTLYAHSYMSRIAGTIGSLLRLDTPTMDCTRLRFARACIEVDLAEPLPLAIWIITPNQEGFKQTIAYEGNTFYCTRCSLHGHSLSKCRFVKHQHSPPCSGTDHPPSPQLVQQNLTSPAPTPTPHPLNTHIHFNSPIPNYQNVDESKECATDVEVLSDHLDDQFDHLDVSDRALKSTKRKKKKNKSKKKSSTPNSDSVLTPNVVDKALPPSTAYTQDQIYNESTEKPLLPVLAVVSEIELLPGPAPINTPSLLTVEPTSPHTTVTAPLEIPVLEFSHSETPSKAFLAMQSSLKELRKAHQGKDYIPSVSFVEEEVNDGFSDSPSAQHKDSPG